MISIDVGGWVGGWARVWCGMGEGVVGARGQQGYEGEYERHDYLS